MEPLAERVAASVRFTTVLDVAPTDDRTAIHSTDQRRDLSYSRLARFCAEGSPVLSGLGPSDRICVATPSGAEGAVMLVFMSRFGCYCPLSPAMPKAEALWVLGDLRPLLLCALPEEAAGLRAAAAELSVPVADIVVDGGVAGLFSLRLDGPAPQGQPADRRDSDPCVALHTSGTTKRPKTVLLTQKSMGTGGLCVAETLRLDRDDVCCVVMPLYHWHALGACVLPVLMSGGSMVVSPLRDPADFFRVVQRRGVTWYSAAPTLHLRIVECAEKVGAGQHRLRLARSCSAALIPSLAQRLAAALSPAVVLPTYAMTESLPICSNPVSGPVKYASVGPAAGPDVGIAVPSECSATPDWVAAGEEGEVVVRGPCVTAGYAGGGGFYEGGWLRTGDLGRLDEDGYLHLTGRLKEVINRGGEKLSPFVIEDALSRHPAIRAVTCFAAPHARVGECVAAACVARHSERPQLSNLRSFLVGSGEVESKWLPECVVWVESLPTGPTGKPARIKLAAQFGVPELPCDQSSFSAAWTDGGWVLEPIGCREDVGGAEGRTVLQIVRGTAVEVMRVAAAPADDASLLECGLDSITAVVLLEALSSKMAVSLPPSLIDRRPTIASLAAAATASRRKAAAAAQPADRQEALKAAKSGDAASLQRVADARGWKHVTTVSDKHGLTALQWAAGGGHLSCCTALLAADPPADVDAPSKEGRTPLMWACRNGHLEVAQLLVARGADPHRTTKKGVNALHWAAWGSALQVADWLHRGLGMDLEVESDAGCNSAVWAAASGSVPCCQWFHSAGADFTKVNHWGHGVVNKAAWKGHADALRWMIESIPGVASQMFLRDAAGFLTVELAEQAGHGDVVRLLREKMAADPQPLQSVGPPARVHEHKARQLDEAK